jgi:hypothetical protein
MIVDPMERFHQLKQDTAQKEKQKREEQERKNAETERNRAY